MIPLGCGVAAADTIPASYVMDFIFYYSDGSHVSVDTVHPYLLRSSSHSSPRWYHLQRLSSDVVLVSPLYMTKPPQCCFPLPLCHSLHLQSLSMLSFLINIILWSVSVWRHAHLHIFIFCHFQFIRVGVLSS